MSSANSSQTPPGGPRAASRAPRASLAGWAGLALLAGIAAYAHRGLLLYQRGLELPGAADVEDWFFQPSDTSPGLILLFTGWLLFRRSARLGRAFGRPGAPATTIALFAAGVGVFWWSVRTGVYELQAVGLFFEGLGVAHAFGGLAALRIAVVPAVFLVFALHVPAPLLNAVVWKFQLWTAEYAGLLLHLLGQPALVSGDQILQSDRVFQIIESCSGLRTAETLCMLAVLMVDLFRRRGGHALLLILAAFPVSFVANGFRALTLILNPHSDITAIHNLQGIVMLLAGVLVLYGLDGVLERVLPQRPAPRESAPPGDGSMPRSAWILTASLVLTLAALSVWLAPWRLEPMRPVQPGVQIAQQLDGWKGTDIKADRTFLGLANFSQILEREYAKGPWRVNAFIGVAGISFHAYSFHTPKTVLPTSGWIVEDRSHEKRGDRQLDVLLVRKGTKRLLVHHWRQWSGGILRETLRTALALDRSPLRRAEIPVVVRLSTPVSGGVAGRKAGERRLEEFSELLLPMLRGWDAPGG